MRSQCPMLALALLAFLTGAALSADVLVTVDGPTIETSGPFEVRGRQVVFTDTDGRLRSIRLTSVDLEASRRATELALRPPPAPSEPPASQQGRAKQKEPALVLTDDNIPSVSDQGAALHAIGIDLESLDSETLGEVVKIAAGIGQRLLALHAEYDLASPTGVARAASSLDSLADELRSLSTRETGTRQALLKQAASGLEQLAQQARTNPEALASQFEARLR